MDYRMRKITFNTNQFLEIEYDFRFKETIYGDFQDAMVTANLAMDKHGYKHADIIDVETGEIYITIEETEEEP